MEPEVSLPSSQQAVTGTNPEPDESIQLPLTLWKKTQETLAILHLLYR